MTTERNTLKDGTVITGFKNDLITNGHRTTKNYYELAMLEFIRDNIKPGVMVDVGANIGNHSLYLGKYCATEVLSFEPFPDTFKILYKNIIENECTNVIPFNVGLSNENKYMRMLLPVENNIGMAKIDEDGDVSIEVERLDAYVLHDPITLIKLDCEGYEEKALLGMIETVKKYKPALFIECQTEKELIAISKILIPLGYSNKQKFNHTPTYYFSA